MSEFNKSLIFANDLLTVRVLSVSEMDNRVYLLTHRASGGQVLIDAADDFAAIEAFAQQAAAADCLPGLLGAGVRALFTTHSHWDHIRARPAALEAWGPVTYCGAADSASIAEQEGVQVQVQLLGGEQLTLAGIDLEVIALRGHTPGSIALALRVPLGADANAGQQVLLFTGDSLFPGGVGKTWSPEDFEQLFADVTERIFNRFDDRTLVLPGHGDST
ncbi:MAG: MBL fold metallo-hydrolase, partial [Rothia sp. (in: high G+C Gram-positive bacteria)]|nr:MBL fold metallo-hydrolase [Rothia sp. (in: high G+C Gram-positive bacteria)]